MHGVTASLKTWLGWWGSDSLESCRRCLGGHGFSAYNAVAGMIGDWGVITTGGGDNVVLAQQAARYLVTSFQKAMAGKQLQGSIDYLNNLSSFNKNAKFSATTPEDLLNSNVQLECYKWLCITLISEAGARLQASMSTGSLYFVLY
jgi:acyl-CoA oxidase